VKQRKPSRPTGAKRASHAKHVADPMGTPMDRAYAQHIRSDRKGVSYETLASRASFWANAQKRLEAQNDRTVEESSGSISEGSPRHGTSFAEANISLATLQSAAAPSGPSSQATIAGLGQGGIAPPPPPA